MVRTGVRKADQAKQKGTVATKKWKDTGTSHWVITGRMLPLNWKFGEDDGKGSTRAGTVLDSR